MTTRQPLQPRPPPPADIINSARGHAAMEAPEDSQDLASVASGLSENDADDDFERLMIQNARDERRLNEALRGRVQAFRKARTHPRVGLTIDNLERNNARNDASLGANAHVKFESPPSSSGSAPSDPAIHAPPAWGRKSRTNRNWMRTITFEEEQQQLLQMPVPTDDTPNGHYDAHQQHADDAHVPRHPAEDSPLSHKSSIHGTPRNDRSAEWDLTFELNEASMIASTPYIPRNTALDEIRQREMESLRDQRVTTARLDRIREGSPEQTRRPRSSTAQSKDTVNGNANTEQALQGAASPRKRLRTRTNSWQSIGKSQPVTGMGKENSPIAMYKSVETVETVERDVLVSSQKVSLKRIDHRREDSQDLLRRLARVSNTPSPGRVAASRPLTAPTRQPSISTQTTITQTPPSPPKGKDEPVSEAPMLDNILEPVATTPNVQTQLEEPNESPRDAEGIPEPAPEALPEAEDVDATPMPVARPMLDPKTPVVTGAWVDTPGPRTVRRSVSPSRSPSRSPQKSSLPKGKPPEEQVAPTAKEAPEGLATEAVQLSLHSSALQALVQEAKANGRRQSADFGDSTINSLEDLITPLPESAEGELDEDTLQGLQLPTSTPRNEAEHQRQQELRHLHRMNDRLRAARTSIRDASRGMRRVEDRVEHAEGGELNNEGAKTIHGNCPCATNGEHQFSLWRWWRSFYWQERLKTARQASNSRWKIWGGLTGLAIFMLIFFTWWISEEIACEIYCHRIYAQSSPYPFSVNMNAPRYPFVIPTLVYRNFIKIWWVPLYSCVSWICATTYRCVFGFDDAAQGVRHLVREGVQSTATRRVWQVSSQVAQVAEESGWDLRMGDDQLLENQR